MWSLLLQVFLLSFLSNLIQFHNENPEWTNVCYEWESQILKCSRVGNKFCGLYAEKVLTIFFYLYLQAVLDSPDVGNIFLEIKTRFPDSKSKFCKSITSLNSCLSRRIQYMYIFSFSFLYFYILIDNRRWWILRFFYICQ